MNRPQFDTWLADHGGTALGIVAFVFLLALSMEAMI